MTRSYLHVKDYEKELNELKKEGFTEKNYIYRQCRATSAATVYGRTTT